MKKVLLLLFVLSALGYHAKAQIGFNYAQYSLGFGTAYMGATTDVPYQKSHAALNLNASYNLTPYTSFTLEYTLGSLTGGYGEYVKDNATSTTTQKDYFATDPFYRSYQNNFQSFILHGDVQFGEFLDYENGGFITNIAKDIYIGTGLGIVYNNIVSINRTSIDGSYVYGGKDHSNNILIPARIGYQYKFYNAYDEPYITLEAGYQKNFVFGYGLDGYSDPTFTYRNYETFGGFNIGIKFNFGDVNSYRKAIH